MINRRPSRRIGHALTAGGLLLLSCVLALTTGCGDGGPDRATVTGRVVLDGQPVKSGSIAFYPAEGTQGPTSGGAIKEGRYQIDSAKGVVVGKSRVEINSPRKSGQMRPNPMDSNSQIEEYVEGIPPDYNSESTLIREIAAGENTIDFDLKSK